FHGSYRNISGGLPSEALLSLTGHLVQHFELATMDPLALFRSLSIATHHDSLVAAGVFHLDWESSMKEGIANRHAYSVTGTYSVRVGDTFVKLVRLRNPWGQGEWEGALAD
ncbi:Uncharacterized protein GBIM_13376, partial [Gryllus bimaculatus]